MESGARTKSETLSAFFLEAVAEVTHTVLTNQSFFPARDLIEVKRWVGRLFADAPQAIFEEAFARAILNPDLPWGKRRFYIVHKGNMAIEGQPRTH